MEETLSEFNLTPIVKIAEDAVLNIVTEYVRMWIMDKNHGFLQKDGTYALFKFNYNELQGLLEKKYSPNLCKFIHSKTQDMVRDITGFVFNENTDRPEVLKKADDEIDAMVYNLKEQIRGSDETE